MIYPENPHYSNRVIKNAGEGVRIHPKDSEEYENAVQLINSWRVAHAFPMSVIAKSLRIRTKRYKNAIVAQRLKRLPTIIDKLSREPEMALSRMQDIGGNRAVVNNVDEVYDLLSYYQNSRKFTPYIKVRDYIAEPKLGGYRGVHIIFKFVGSMSSSKGAEDYEGLSIETQLRTQLQHTWATAVETMSTMRGENYKSGQGSSDWLEYFALASAAFSILEKSPLPVRYKDLDILQIGREMKKLDVANKIMEQITGFTYAANIIHSESIGGQYNLITLNIKEHIVNILSFEKQQLEEASIEYRKTEERASNGENIESVLVSAGKLKSLKLAYPNYFLDISSFYEKINVLYSVIDKSNI